MTEKNQNQTQEDRAKALEAKNKKVALIVLSVVFGMMGLAFASVPLYDLFCRVTGYGGTTQVADALPDQVLDRVVKVRFNTTTVKAMDWDFQPDRREVSVQLGARGFISYHARNNGDQPLVGTALYNVTPAKAGKYFQKIQCFCFGEQRLDPHEEVDMPVIFYIDPAMDNDPNLKDVTTITLSYTFFEADTSELEEAMEGFYNEQEGAISTTDF